MLLYNPWVPHNLHYTVVGAIQSVSFKASTGKNLHSYLTLNAVEHHAISFSALKYCGHFLEPLSLKNNHPASPSLKFLSQNYFWLQILYLRLIRTKPYSPIFPEEWMEYIAQETGCLQGSWQEWRGKGQGNCHISPICYEFSFLILFRMPRNFRS